MTLLQDFIQVVLIGVGATLIMDVWLSLLKLAGIQTLNFGYLGRWVGHLFLGKLAHVSIGAAQPIPKEVMLGWVVHYAVGIAFAGLLLAIFSLGWARNPTVLPAILMGMSTTVVPLFVMQPAMGLGFAASKTPVPLKNCIRSLATHTIFGLGLYLSALFIQWITY